MFQNQKFWTLKAVEYLAKNTNPNLYKLILIDNGSDEKIGLKVKEFSESLISDIEYVYHKKELGVSFAYMSAIKDHGKNSDYFVVLHNDVFVSCGWLDSFINHVKLIENKDVVDWSCIFPRASYCTEETPCSFDKEIKDIFIEKKLYSKAFFTTEEIEKNLEDIYCEFDGFDSYSKNVKSQNLNYFKIVQEMCVFCTMFKSKVFFDCNGFDVDFLKRRSEAKILNDIAMSKASYPVLALDVFVHHHGNLTTDGPGKNFSLEFEESELLYKEKVKSYFEITNKKNKMYTKFYNGAKVLFIREGGVGDIIMSMFAIQGFKNLFPNTKITYMTKFENFNFIKGFKCIDEIIPINLNYDFSYSERENIDNSKKIKEFEERFDFVQNWIKYVEFYDKRDIHRIEKFLYSIPVDGVEAVFPEFLIDQQKEERFNKIFEENNQKKIVICMSGTCLIRSFPNDVAMKIIDLESEKGNKVFVVGNSVDINLEKIKNKENVLDLGFSLDLEELMILIKKSNCVYTPDTGVFHMASLIGTPCKAFFGPIDPNLRDGGYYGNRNKIYFKKGILPCVPCRDMGCKEVPCMIYSEDEIKRIVNEQC